MNLKLFYTISTINKDMGYTTDFGGWLNLSRQLTKEEKDYINTFSETRRMRRDVNKLMELYKGKHGNPHPADNTPDGIYGNEGEYFAFDDGNTGQIEDASILDYNAAPGQRGFDANSDFNARWSENKKRINAGECQPGLWCQWIVREADDDDQNDILEWDGGEKFYNYVEWLKYMIAHFFSKWGVILNGEIEWFGEDYNDRGKIVVTDNVVEVFKGRITYEKT